MKNLIKEWGMSLVVAIILYLLLTRFVFFSAQVPTPSMYPTIQDNDKMFVARIYNPENLKRGDIVVFYFKEKGEKLVKRLIGLPGDKVEVKLDGSVYVNGEKLDELYVKNPGGIGGNYEVPSSSYFFLGDNRDNSLDSRYWSNPYIPSSDILGKAQFVYFPFSRFGKLK